MKATLSRSRKHLIHWMSNNSTSSYPDYNYEDSCVNLHEVKLIAGIVLGRKGLLFSLFGRLYCLHMNMLPEDNLLFCFSQVFKS